MNSKLIIGSGFLVASLALIGSPVIAAESKITPVEKAELRQDRKEIRGDRHEIKADRRELRKDHKELRSDRRELRRDLKNGASKEENRPRPQ